MRSNILKEYETKANSMVKDLLSYIEKSPTCFQAVENAEKQLAEAGYVGLEEKEKWELTPGGKYYVDRNGSALIAFQIPQGDFVETVKGFHMVASHSDSPCFKIKEAPEIQVENQYVKLNAEKYGGMILSTWLDRPLSVAGRVVAAGWGNAAGTETASTTETNTEEKERTWKTPVIRNVVIDRDLCIIPNVAIHMNRDMNKGVEYNAQTDMLPLYAGIASGEEKASFLKRIAEAAGVKEEEILGSDLFLYNREKGRIFGAESEFVCAPRLDDLECVYSSLQALLHSESQTYVNMMVVFDNEEVGSSTRQGAASTFLKDTLTRICESFEVSEGNYCRMMADSFLISADNAHAVHPNHPEKADPTNRPYLNGGIVIKYHGSQKYTTDAISGAMMKEICNWAKVPYQTYANRSDIPGGSTLGNISTAQVPVSTVDIGLPQLAMHSAYETAGAKDVEYMVKALECFYQM